MIDTLSLPVCVYTRAPRDRCLSHMLIMVTVLPKRWITIGFKLSLRIARSGMVTYYPLLPAQPHDIQFLEELSENFSGTIPARKNMTEPHPFRLRQVCQYWRKRSETVGSQLTGRFAIDRIRARDLWHYQHRLIRKILAHTVCVFLNLMSERNPLDLDGLLA